MINKITKILMVTFAMSLFVDISHAIKLPGGLGKKKKKSSAKAAVSYNLQAPEYDPGLVAYGVIGAFDLGIAGAPACLAVMKAQISLATANKQGFEALGLLTEALANKELKEQLTALQEKIDAEEDAEKKAALVKEKKQLSSDGIDLADEKAELSKEQAELLSVASGKIAASWLLIGAAGKEAAELPELIKDGIDEVKDAIDNAKKDGIKGLKAVAGLTANLKGIQGAVKLPGQFIESGKLQSELFGKIGRMLKNNGYESPSIEEASKKDKDF